MKLFGIISVTWLAIFLIAIFALIGFLTLESIKPVEKERYCLSDSDCSCGRNALTGECFYGNKNFINASEQCPDFCGRIGENLGIKCIKNECKQIQKAECSADADCGTGGCSGQVCGQKDKVQGIITTCEYLPEYGCLKKTNCGCVSGKCEWKKTQEYLDCMKPLGK